MVPDPYKALNLSHDATQSQIKIAYRKLALKYHPDRLTRRNASDEEMAEAVAAFSKISSAYSILSDANRKREYDHIYKYGGYDHEEEKIPERRQPSSSFRSASCPGFTYTYGDQNNNEDPLYPKHDSRGNRVSQTGIGYVFTDHLTNILSQGRRKSTTVAGIHIPSRVHLSRQPGENIKFAYASGELKTTPMGTKTYTSKTTQFVSGKKFVRTESTTLHKDGRKETVIEGNDYIERRVSPPTKKAIGQQRGPEDDDNVAQHDENSLPWYMNAWHGIRDSLTVCYNPCVPVR